MASAAPSSSNSCTDPNWTYDQDLQIDMQMKCIIKSGLPFHIFDNQSWTTYVQTALQPEYKRVSKTIIKRLALKHYLEAKKELINYLEHLEGKVSLTSAIWKSDPRFSLTTYYICITCHWIDPTTWKMCKRVIAIEAIERYPHKAQDIYSVIMQSICEFKIKNKIMSISFDNASYNTTVIEMLKRDLNPMLNGILFHTKCACHIINSIANSCLEYVGPVISKFQNMLLYIFFSPIRRQEFKHLVFAQGEKFLEPEINIPDRWNSTYKMLSRIVCQKSLLIEYYTSCAQNDINDNDWEIIESLLNILEVFYNSTLNLSDAYYPTTPLLLGETLLIANIFKEYKQHPFWQPLIFQIQSKFLEYYETMHPIYSCAAALNPMIGVEGVENILEDIAANLGLDMNDVGDMNDNDYAKDSITKFTTVFCELFDYYDTMYTSRAREQVPINMILQSASRKKSNVGSILSELELYKKTDFSRIMSYDEYENLNNLEWWRNKGRHIYPVLGAIARDILTIQASTVASGYAFCLNGRVLNEMMSRLSFRWLEIRVFLKDHFDTNGWQQNVDFVDDRSEEKQNVNLAEDDSEESEEE